MDRALKIRLCRLVKLDWCAAPVFRFRHMARVAARHTTDEPLAEHEGGQDGGEDQQNLSGWESDHLSCLRLELVPQANRAMCLPKKKGPNIRISAGNC